jgi:hypothetical protein
MVFNLLTICKGQNPGFLCSKMGLGRKPDPREQYKSVHTPGFCPPPRNCGCCCSGLISTSRRQKAEGRKPGPMSQSRLSAQPHFGDGPAPSIPPGPMPLRHGPGARGHGAPAIIAAVEPARGQSCVPTGIRNQEFPQGFYSGMGHVRSGSGTPGSRNSRGGYPGSGTSQYARGA